MMEQTDPHLEVSAINSKVEQVVHELVMTEGNGLV